MLRHSLAAALAAALAPLAIVGCATAPDRPAAVAPSGQLAIGEHQASLNGARIWYRVAGTWDGRSAPVVYLAGGPGGNSYVFERSAGPLLEPHRLVVYYDQRGTGRSERPASGDYAIATLVEDIEALRVHVGVPRIAVVAHSFGGVLGLEYAARHPARLAALVLTGVPWSAPAACCEQAEQMAVRRPEAYRRVLAAGPFTEADVCERVFRAFPGREAERFHGELMFPEPAILDLLNRIEAESGLSNTGELSRAIFSQGLLRYRFANPEQLRMPVLVVGGSRDFAAGPRAQRALADALPRGRLLEYEGLGHWMFLEDPQRFARDVAAFLRSAERR